MKKTIIAEIGLLPADLGPAWWENPRHSAILAVGDKPPRKSAKLHQNLSVLQMLILGVRKVPIKTLNQVECPVVKGGEGSDFKGAESVRNPSCAFTLIPRGGCSG